MPFPFLYTKQMVFNDFFHLFLAKGIHPIYLFPDCKMIDISHRTFGVSLFKRATKSASIYLIVVKHLSGFQQRLIEV